MLMFLTCLLSRPLFCSVPGSFFRTDSRTAQSVSPCRHLRTHLQALVREMDTAPSTGCSVSQTTSGL